MNWYKKYCSHNLRFPENIDYQIDNIVNIIVDFYKSYKGIPLSPIFIGNIEFLDKYSEKNIICPIFINNAFAGKDIEKSLAKRDRRNGNIYINVIKEIENKKLQFNFNYLFYLIRGCLYHELTHSIDPKIRQLDKNYNNINEFLKPTEFDAYSQEITKYIKNAYKIKENQEIILKWLSSFNFGYDNIDYLLNMPENLYSILLMWKKNNPIYFKKIRQRVYNEVIVT